MEDVDQNIHLRNLSIHTVSSREEALDLLFQGDFNRVVAAVSTSNKHNIKTKACIIRSCTCSKWFILKLIILFIQLIAFQG